MALVSAATVMSDVVGRTRLLRCHTSSLLLHAALSHIRLHDLRHAYATLLLTRGVHPRSFRELLDHRTISIALDTNSFFQGVRS